MKPAPFEYHRPETIEEAVALLGELGDAAKVLAGGQSLIPMLALRLTAFDHLVDIGAIAELTGIERRDGQIWIGAGTRFASVEASPDAAAGLPLLTRATRLIGHFQIRNRGTAGGSLAHADPAAEYPAVALALGAGLHVRSPRSERTVAAADFFEGLWTTSMEPDELLVAVSFPSWSGRCGFAVEEFARRHGDFAIAGAALGVQLDAQGRVTRCAIGLLGLGAKPERAGRAEESVVGSAAGEIDAEEIGRLAMAELESVPADLHGSAEYRKRVGAAMVARAWATAVTEAADA
jgi:aerobic carbon-monoxide dehydrogenase medium subunit